MTRPVFTEQQRRAIELRDGSCLLSAAAGSGKTAVMVERFCQAILNDGTRPDQILAISFTEKAAAELRTRITERLRVLGATDVELDQAWIGTIHSFCGRFLRQEALAAGLDPAFKVADARLTRRLFDQAYAESIAELYRGDRELLVQLSFQYPSLRSMIERAYDDLRSRGDRSPRISLPRPVEEPSLLKQQLIDLAVQVRLELREATGTTVERALSRLVAVEELLQTAIPQPQSLQTITLPKSSKQLKSELCDNYRLVLQQLVTACANYYAYPLLVGLDKLLMTLSNNFAQLKRRRSLLDFHDLQLATAHLLKSNSDVRLRWSQRFGLLMVDEFQDTDPVQSGIFESLEQNNLFVVGDEFQSIYSFRYADVEIFRRRAAMAEVNQLTLSSNFRSVAAIIDFANGISRDRFGSSFTPLICGLKEDNSVNNAQTVEFLLTPKFSSDTETLEGAGKDSEYEAQTLAQEIKREIESGTRPDEIAVLVRAAASLAPIATALTELGVPNSVIGGRGFWSSQIIVDTLCYLRVLANPLDEEALVAFLGSQLCQLPLHVLAELATTAREHSISKYEALSSSSDPRLSLIARLIEQERAQAIQLPVAELCRRMMIAIDGQLVELSDSDYRQSLANVRKLSQIADQFAEIESPGLRRFLTFAIEEVALKTDEGDAALESDGLNAVRLLTIHRSKGLEFPVVCLYGLGRRRNLQGSTLLFGENGSIGHRLSWGPGFKSVPAFDYEQLRLLELKQELAEEARLFYVAITRAQRRLVLSGVWDAKTMNSEKPRSPLDWLLPAAGGERLTYDSDPNGSIKPTESDQRVGYRIIERSPNDRTITAARTGHHRMFDLRLPQCEEEFTLPALPQMSYSVLKSYEDCGYRFYIERLLRYPARNEHVDGGIRASSNMLSARLRGVVVHRLLETIELRAPLAISEQQIIAAAERAQISRLSSASLEAIRDDLSRFTASQLYTDIAAASRLWRERGFGFTIQGVDRSHRITGSIDLWLEGSDGVTIIDYKTDSNPFAECNDPVERYYGIQRDVYALAAIRAGLQKVKIVFCFLQDMDRPIERVYTNADISQLEMKLSTRCDSAAVGPYLVTESPSLRKCSGCPARGSLCSYNAEQIEQESWETETSPRLFAAN